MADPTATGFHFYADTYRKLSEALNTYVSDVATSLIGAISDVTYTLLLIYVMLWGWPSRKKQRNFRFQLKLSPKIRRRRKRRRPMAAGSMPFSIRVADGQPNSGVSIGLVSWQTCYGPGMGSPRSLLLDLVNSIWLKACCVRRRPERRDQPVYP